MKGPIAPGSQVKTSATFGGSAPTTPGVELVDSSGGVVLAHSTSGIINERGLTYSKVLTIPAGTPNGFLTPYWDRDGGTPFPDEDIWVNGAVAVLPVVAGPGGVTPYTADSPYRAKRGDTDPIFGPVQLADAAGNPATIEVGSTVMLTVVKLAPAFNGVLDRVLFAPPADFATGNRVYHKAIPAWDDTAGYGWKTSGEVSYRFPKDDLDWVGYSLGEIEVNTTALRVRSYPGAQAAPEYIPMLISPDEDEGLDP